MLTTAVKILDQTSDIVRVGGYGVVFGGEDLDGETFGPHTDFMLGMVPQPPVFYDHTLRDVKNVLGRAVKVQPDDDGLWVEAELDRHAEYMRHVITLAEKGVLGWSSGSVGHLTLREGKSITRWPIVEMSLTPTPAEPRTLGVDVLKSLAQIDGTFEALLPETDRPSVAQDADETKDAPPVIEVIESAEDTMADNEQGQAQPENTLEHSEELKVMRGQITDLSTAINQVLQYVQDTPKIKNVGYVTEDGGSADPEVKSFGDWLLAVQRRDVKRLSTVYGAKNLNESVGVSGGFTVPEGFERQMMQMATASSIVRSRATVIPVAEPTGKIPALNQFTAPTVGVGHTAFAGGIVAAWTDEAATLGETNATFEQVEWHIHKMGGYTKVTNELIADSAIAIESLLTALFGRAVAAMEDYAFLRGDGVGKPLGILNAPCTIAVSTVGDNAFVLGDATNMLAQFWPYMGRTQWIMHPGVIPDLDESTFGTTGNAMPYLAPREQFGNATVLAQPLLGYPVVLSEHMPNANTDDVILADLSAYLIFDRQGMAISYSEHSAFTTDEGTWKFTKRLDGKPWLTGVITLGSPVAYTVSPFLYHND